MKLKNVYKRVVSFILIFSFAVFSFPVSAATSTYQVTIDGITYIIESTVEADGTVVTTVTDGVSNTIVERTDEEIIIIEEDGVGGISSYSIDLNIQYNMSPSPRIINSISDRWGWGFSAYNNTDSAYLDIYWRAGISYKSPSQVNYFAAHGTSLMDYSNTYYNEIIQMDTNMRKADDALGWGISASIAGGLGALLIAGGPLTLAIILGVLGGYGAAAIAAQVYYVDACTNAKTAELYYGYIVSLA